MSDPTSDLTNTNAAARYSRGAVILHWLIAALVLFNVVVALATDDAPKPVRMYWMPMHMAVGVLVLALSVIRIGWRISHRPPPLDPALATWERMLATGVHALFYVLLIAIPITGWLMVSAPADAGPISFFGLFNVPALPVAGNKTAEEIGHEGHEIMGFVMIGLVLLHVAGALKHQLFDRRPSLGRMWFG